MDLIILVPHNVRPRLFFFANKQKKEHSKGLNTAECDEDRENIKVHDTAPSEWLQRKERYLKSILKVRHE